MAIRRSYYYYYPRKENKKPSYYSARRKSNKMKIILYAASTIIVLGNAYSLARQVIKPKAVDVGVAKQQQKADQNISNLYIQSQELKNTMQQQNATVVLSGTKHVAYTFSNQQGELNSKGNPVGFLKKTLDSLTVKKLTYETEYSYMSVYDNQGIETKVEGDKLYITIFERSLSIKGIDYRCIMKCCIQLKKTLL
jgi:hypothetical protein